MSCTDSQSSTLDDVLEDDRTRQSLPRSGLAPNITAWDTRTEYLEASRDELLPPPDFKPFFALIEDPVTGEHHHPTVHYVFSDDEDQSVLTSAALAAIDQQEQGTRDGESEERIVMLDMQGDGRTILSTASLSPDWQVVRTDMSPAPSWGDSQQGTAKGLMLKVSGKERAVDAALGSQERNKVEALMDRYARQLENLVEILGKEEEHIQTDVGSASPSQRPGSELE